MDPLLQLATTELDRSRPLTDQIVSHLTEAIDSGALPVGTRLPPIRTLASQLRVNRNTVAHAIRELAEKGFVRTRFGGGSIAARPAPLSAPNEPDASSGYGLPDKLDEADLERRFSRHLNGSLAGTSLPLFSAADPRPINLFQMRPDTGLFPLERFRRCLNTVLRRSGRHLLNYGSPAGYLPLREQIARRLQQAHIAAEPNQILVLTGSQQGIDLLARAFIDAGDRIAVESPMYSIALKIFAMNGARLVPYTVTRQGVDFRPLEQLGPQQSPKLFYAVPNFQNPTTHSYRIEERELLLRHARRLDSLVIEDASDNELHGEPEQWPALAALDGSRRVLYLNTFSKTLVPAVRVGYLCAPAPLVRRLTELKEMTDLSQSLILQAAIAEFMERGYFDEHVEQLRRAYHRRMERVLDMLDETLPDDTPFSRPDGGLCVWVDLPGHIDVQSLFEQLRGRGVLVSPGSLYQSQSSGRNGIRLCVATEPESRLQEGFRILGRELNEVLRRPAPPAAEQEYQSIH